MKRMGRGAIFGLVLGTNAAAAADYYSNIAQWLTATAPDFTIAAPIDFDTSQGVTASNDWRANQDRPGQVLARITIPRAIESQTNFDGANLTIGRSGDPQAIAACLNGKPVSSRRINGVSFAAYSASDAGMSHYHDITSYRAIHKGACYAMEYSIASTALGVYDPALGLKPFHQARVKAILERIAGTFRFV